MKLYNFLPNIGLLAVSSLTAQLLSMISLILLRRELEDHVFADYTIAVTICLIVSAISALKLDRLIALTKSKRRVANLISSSLVFIIPISLITPVIGSYWHLLDYWFYMYFISFTSSFIVVLQATCFYFSMTLMLAFGRILQVFATLILILMLSILHFDLSSALLCLLLGQLVHCAVLLFGVSQETLIVNAFKNLINFKTIILSFRELSRNKSYIKYIAPEAFLGTFLPNLPIFIIDANFSDKITADYAIIYKFIATPLSAVTQAISGLLYPKYVRLTSTELVRLFRKIVLVGMLILTLAIIISLIYLSGVYVNIPLFISINKSMILIILFYFGLASVFNSMSGIHLLVGLQRHSLLFTVLMVICKTPIVFMSWTSVSAVLTSIYFVDLFFVLAINIMCYKRILQKC